MWVCASLSRISHNLDMLLHVLEYLLAHDVSVLTSNCLNRPHDAWVRRGERVLVNRDALETVTRLIKRPPAIAVTIAERWSKEPRPTTQG